MLIERSKRILKRTVMLGLLILAIVFTVQGQAKSVPNESAAPRPGNESGLVGKTALQNSSFLMVDIKTKRSLMAQNEDLRRPPASTVKLLTGLVALERLKESDLIRVGQEVKSIEGSKIGLQPGDRITVKDLLKAVYVESANDAAAALGAAWGTLDEFTLEMNKKAKSLGCTDSNFLTPHGLPFPDQYSTACDLVRIASTFIQNEQLMKYVRLKETTIQWTLANNQKQSRKLQNTNQLLNIYPGDIGLKTGTTTEAGQCLISLVDRPDGTILLALLGSKARYGESIALLDQGYAKLRTGAALKRLSGQPDSLMKSMGYFIP